MALQWRFLSIDAGALPLQTARLYRSARFNLMNGAQMNRVYADPDNAANRAATLAMLVRHILAATV